jgi:guanylate kinase
MTEEQAGIPIVISAPSGTGKTSLCIRLLQTLSRISRSVSYTTRTARAGEIDGRDYHFVDEPTFDRMVDEDAFIEWARVFDHRYGTGLQATREQLERGVDVLLDIDVQGGAQIRSKLPDAVLIFLLPPSLEELRRRLQNRAKDTPQTIERRLREARDEVRASADYEYLVVNDDFDRAAIELRGIIRAHRIKKNRPRDVVRRLLEP